MRNKIDDIVHIVEDFDIVCFTETHLDQRVPTNNLVIPGFNSNPFSGLDRTTYGGDIMMYFKDNINIVPRTHLQSITLSNSTLCCHWETRTSMLPMFVDK